MSLVYHRSSKNAARKYARSPHMEPNGGVTAMTVVNPGRPPRSNPFQWIEGRGLRHRHASPSYSTLRGAASWRQRAGESHKTARLYATDERGTVLSRPIGIEKLAPNDGEESSSNDDTEGDGDMYNVEALRRAIRANGVRENHGYDPDNADEEIGEAMGSAYTETQRRAVRRMSSKPKRKSSAKKKTGARRKTSRKVSVKQRRDGSVSVSVRSRKAAKRKTSRKTSAKRSVAKRTTARRSSARRATKRTSRSVKRTSRRKAGTRKGSRKAAKKRTSARKTSRKGSRRKTSKLAANRSSKLYEARSGTGRLLATAKKMSTLRTKVKGAIARGHVVHVRRDGRKVTTLGVVWGARPRRRSSMKVRPRRTSRKAARRTSRRGTRRRTSRK